MKPREKRKPSISEISRTSKVNRSVLAREHRAGRQDIYQTRYADHCFKKRKVEDCNSEGTIIYPNLRLNPRSTFTWHIFWPYPILFTMNGTLIGLKSLNPGLETIVPFALTGKEDPTSEVIIFIIKLKIIIPTNKIKNSMTISGSHTSIVSGKSGLACIQAIKPLNTLYRRVLWVLKIACSWK